VTLVLLGSSGFIGGRIHSVLSQGDSDFITCDRNADFYYMGRKNTRDKIDKKTLKNLGEEITVVNMVGNAVGTDHLVLNANYTFPISVLDALNTLGIKIRWIQASSYFQNYKKSFGVDKNFYAKTKQQFVTELYSRQSNHNLDVINLVLPHVTGVSEPERRLIPQLIKAKLTNQVIYLSSGLPMLPIVGVEELSSRVVEIAQDCTFHDGTAIYPTAYMTVREIAQLILNEQIELAMFGKLPDRMNEFHTIESIGMPNAMGDNSDVLSIFTRMEMHWLDRCKSDI